VGDRDLVWLLSLLQTAHRAESESAQKRSWDKPRRWQLASNRCSEGRGVSTREQPVGYGAEHVRLRQGGSWLRVVFHRPGPASPRGFLKVEEHELSARFARAQMALAKSLGQRGEGQSSLGHALHMLGNLKEAEQDVCAHLLREDTPPFDRANCLTALAGVLRDQGRLGEALEKAEEAAATAKTLPETCPPPETPHQYYLALCHLKEASILERMGRLKEATAKDQLCPPPLAAGGVVRVALLAVARGRLEEASTNLRTVMAHAGGGDPMNVEGPDLLLRAKALLCQVLHTLRERSADPGAEAEETALRAELRHEEARRGEALREVRALVRQVTGEREGGARKGEEAHLVAVVPKPSRKKKSKKGKRGRRRRAAAAAAQDEKGEEKGTARPLKQPQQYPLRQP
jgi:tetratricopeptide (TPR) repeat protein